MIMKCSMFTVHLGLSAFGGESINRTSSAFLLVKWQALEYTTYNVSAGLATSAN